MKLLPNIEQREGGYEAIYNTPRYNRFRQLLGIVIRRKWLVAGSVVGAFLVAVLGLGLVKKQFFPTSDRPEVLVEVQMAYGTSIEQTNATTAKVEAWLAKQPEAKTVTAANDWMEEYCLTASRNDGIPVAMGQPSTTVAYASVVLAAVLWGGSIVAQKMALGSFSAVEASVLRDIGGLAILLITWWSKEGAAINISRTDMRLLGLLGLGVLGNHLFILMGLTYVSGAVGGVIIGSSPVVTALLSAMLIRDVPLRAVWAGAILSFAGVGLVSVAGFQAAGEQPLLGSTLVFLGVVSWALYSIGSRAIMERISALTVNWTTLMVATVIQIPLLWTNQKMMHAGVGSVTTSDWLALGYLILFATAAAQQAWLFGVKGIGPSRASVMGNLTPVAAIGLSALILGESVGLIELIGIGLILAGVWILNRQTAGLNG